MTSLHSDLVGTSLHEAFHYVQSSDPGVVGASKYWLDTTSEPYILKRRKATDDGWITLGVSTASGATGWINVTDHGALGDDATNDEAAIEAAIDAVQAAGGGTLYFPMTVGGGKYRHTGGFDKLQTAALRKPIRVLCDSGVQVRPTTNVTVFQVDQDDTGTFTDILTTVIFENVWVKPVTTGHATAFRITDSFGVKFINCMAQNCAVGLMQESVDSWTEGLYGSISMDNCTIGYETVKVGGTGSMQSTFLTGWIRTASGGTAVKIGANTQITGNQYNWQIWPVGNGCIGIDMQGDGHKSIWHGTVDLAGATPTPAYALQIGAGATDLTTWQFDMEFRGTYNGGEEESGAVKNASVVSWTHSTLPYATGGGVADQLDANGTILDVNVINDGEYLQRSGTTIISNTPAGGGASGGVFTNYDADLYPAAPNAANDEFDDDVISGTLTSFGTPTASESLYHGFLQIKKTGSGTEAGYYQAFVPGAAAFAVACKMSAQVFKAASNQAFIGVRDSGGANIVSIGKLGSSSQVITKAAAIGGGFAVDGALTYITGNMGDIYFVITRDATTNYNVYASHDGKLWWLVQAFSQAGTVARIYFGVEPQSATEVEAIFDFIRAFSSATTKIGNTP